VALHGVQAKARALECLKHLTHVILVLGEAVAVDEYIVQVRGAELVKEGTKSVIDEALKGGRGVSKSELHDQGFKETITSAEGSLPFVSLLNADQVVGRWEIQRSVLLGHC
jgi:hypothetical protein